MALQIGSKWIEKLPDARKEGIEFSHLFRRSKVEIYSIVLSRVSLVPLINFSNWEQRIGLHDNFLKKCFTKMYTQIVLEESKTVPGLGDDTYF